MVTHSTISIWRVRERTKCTRLALDYASNVALYPQFQAYFRKRQPPLLAVWGRDDPFFLPAGAKAYRRDISGADIRFCDTGHFHWKHIAQKSLPLFETSSAGRQRRQPEITAHASFKTRTDLQWDDGTALKLHGARRLTLRS